MSCKKSGFDWNIDPNEKEQYMSVNSVSGSTTPPWLQAQLQSQTGAAPTGAVHKKHGGHHHHSKTGESTSTESSGGPSASSDVASLLGQPASGVSPDGTLNTTS